MVRNKLAVLVYIIIGLAVVGIVTQLFTNTASFITNLFLMIGIGAAIFAAIYFIFLKNRASSNEMKKYKQAVKQSKAKYKQQSNPNVKPSVKKQVQPLKNKKSAKRATHLRVIEGNKSKSKKRASN